MTRAGYVEVQSKSALNRVYGMPFEWSLNPYAGCEHSCGYCYARQYFAVAGKDPGRGFDRTIEARMNVPALLAAELRRPRSGSLAIGTATDPYQPAEGRYELTRRCLEVLLRTPLPMDISLITKGTLIVRDAELLGALSRRTELRVFFSIGSVDPVVAKALEPDAPPSRSRLRALERLRAAGVKACVICAPIVPGFGDAEASIAAVLRTARGSRPEANLRRLLLVHPALLAVMVGVLLTEV